MATKGDGVRMADGAIRAYKDQARDLSTEFDELDDSYANVKGELDQAIENIAVGLLPICNAELFQQVIQETGALQLTNLWEELQQGREERKVRNQDILASEDYQRREMLIHPTTGEYTVKIVEHKEFCDSLNSSLKRYDFKNFRYCYKNKLHRPKEHGMFGGFWRFVTMAESREKSAIEATLKRLRVSSLDEAFRTYEADQKSMKFHKKELKDWKAKSEGVSNLIEERDENDRWLKNFSNEARAEMRKNLQWHLRRADLESIHKTIRAAGKILVATAHALAKKLEYIENMKNELRNEIRDREKRVDSIERVKRKWQGKPWAPLYGDKSKWLVKVPKIKKGSTRKRIRWVGTMRRNIHGYHRYDKYSHYMDGPQAFLAYDAFSYGAEERMPYEGFTRGVITEMDDWRQSNGQEKADFSYFKGMRKAGDEYDEDWGWDEYEEEQFDYEEHDGDEYDSDGDDDFAAAALAGEADDSHSYDES
ncbi:MAG: hypothetical protein P1V97_23400 [Planctomycetota bacterium]|nr:hypothetical protein [Planctomycetota bacterium]